MNTVLIQSAIPCDAATGNPLPPSTTIPGGFRVTVTPKPLGNTELLQIAVICTLIPGPSGPVDFELDLQNLANWALVNINQGAKLYPGTPVSSGVTVRLNFQLRNLTPSGHTFSAPLILKAKDPNPAHPNLATKVITLNET